MYWLYEEQQDRGLEDMKLESLQHAANAYAQASEYGRQDACKPVDWCEAALNQVCSKKKGVLCERLLFLSARTRSREQICYSKFKCA